MEYIEYADQRPEPISIARCRELLGDEAESMTDQDIEDMRQQSYREDLVDAIWASLRSLARRGAL